MKKYLLAIFVCVLSFMLCGCSNAPTYSLSQSADGKVTQTIFIPYVESELTGLGVEQDVATEIGNTIRERFNLYFLNLKTNFETRVDTDPELTVQDKLTLKSGCEISFAPSELGFLYTLTFTSALHYYYFNSDLQYNDLIEELSMDNSVTEKGFFTNKIISTGSTVFGLNTQFAENQTLAQYITSYATTLLNENTSLTAEQIQAVVPNNFVYCYGTTSSKLHSDADRTYRYIDGLYYHEWDISSQDSERQISTWTIEVNSNVWYATILICAFVLLGILLIVDYKKRHQKGDKQAE